MSNDTKIEVKSLQEFLGEISEFHSNEVIYRGQSDEKWGVESGAYRRLDTKNVYPTLKKILNYDKKLSDYDKKLSDDNKELSDDNKEFLKELSDSHKALLYSNKELLDYNRELIRGCRHYSQKYNKLNDFELLVKLQHNGAATSLIDFTGSALIALWFACENSKTDGKIFCLEKNNDEFLEVSSKDVTKIFDETPDEILDKILNLDFRKEKKYGQLRDNLALYKPSGKKNAIWKPAITDGRILKQDSIFVFNKEGKLDAFHKEIIINQKYKEQIRKELKQKFYFSEETIFPDFYGFANNNSVNKPYGPQDIDGYLRQGNEHFRLGQYDKAIKDYDAAIKFYIEATLIYGNFGFGLESKAILLYICHGLAYFKKGQYDKAINNYDKAIELDPRSASACTNKGMAYFEKGQYEEAVKYYDKAVNFGSRSVVVYIYCGMAYFEKGQYDKAINIYNKAIELDPNSASAYTNRGMAYQKKGEVDLALKDFDKAIELDPKAVAIYYNRGIAYFKKGQYDIAIKDFTKAIELDSNFVNAYCNRALAYLKKGEVVLALKDYEKALELYELEGNIPMVKKLENSIKEIKDKQ